MKPLTFGYWALGSADADRDGGGLGWALQEQIGAVARSEGYCLAGVFNDVLGVSDAGLLSMVTALGRGEEPSLGL